MSDKRYAVMFLRLGLLASVLFAVFWGAWYLSGHQVPAYAGLKITENMSLIFPISRWWDIPFAFLLVNVYAWIFRVYLKFCLKLTEKDDPTFSFAISLIAIIAIGLIAIGIGLIAGLGVGLIAIIGVILIASLGVILIVSLMAGLVVLIKVLFSPNFWKPIYNWFAAKHIS